jgi:hypothetical protein
VGTERVAYLMSKPFDEGKPLSYKAQVRKREKIVVEEMAKLLALESEDDLGKTLKKVYGITPEMPQYQKILSIWRSS